MSNCVYLELESYCLNNKDQIFEVKYLYKESFKDFSLCSFKCAVNKLKIRRIIKHLYKDVYFIGKEIPSDIDQLIIDYLSSRITPREEKPQKVNNKTPIIASDELENVRINMGDDEYFKRKKIGLIMKARDLDVPKTTGFHIVLYSLLFLLIAAGIGVGVYFLPLPVIAKVFIYIASYLLFLEFYLRFFLIQVVKCYQHYAKEETRRKCVCIPSCSEYAIDVLKKYELIVAIHKSRRRLYKVCVGETCRIHLP